jgi:hypothetical protein
MLWAKQIASFIQQLNPDGVAAAIRHALLFLLIVSCVIVLQDRLGGTPGKGSDRPAEAVRPEIRSELPLM